MSVAQDRPDPAQADSWRAALRDEWRHPRERREAARLAAWGILAYGLLAPAIRLTVGYDAIGFPVTLAAALAALLWVAPRQGEFRTWLFYVVALYFFAQLRDAADETTIAASTGYVLDWEKWLFGGTTPSAWLQAQVGGGEGDPGPAAFFSTLMHWSWFFLPHAVVVGTYFLARPMFFRVAAIMLGIFFSAVALYYLVPTVPPWLAERQGDTTGIRRIMEDVGPTLFGQAVWDELFTLASEPNPRAAMPSLHFAAACQIGLIGWLLHSRKLMGLAVVYSAALAFALMYLGEHYFVDILVGGLLAGASFLIVERVVGGPGWGRPWRLGGWRPARWRAPRPKGGAVGRAAAGRREAG